MISTFWWTFENSQELRYERLGIQGLEGVRFAGQGAAAFRIARDARKLTQPALDGPIIDLSPPAATQQRNLPANR